MKLRDIKGIGPKKEQLLNEMGISNIYDLLTYLPRYYEDRSHKHLLKEALEGQKHYFELEVISPVRTHFVRKNLTITRVVARDSSMQCQLIWYNDRFSAQRLKQAERYKFFGRFDKEKKVLINPIISELNDDTIGGIYPIYSVVKGISAKELIRFKDNLFSSNINLDDYINASMHEQVLDAYQMYEILHRPQSYIDLYQAKKSYLIRQLTLDALLSKIIKSKNTAYTSFKNYDLSGVINDLAFRLTPGQNDALQDIINDMISDKMMNRILIGDVGSGKTIVAILASILAIKNNYQVAFMAPTELLARQHYNNYKDFLESYHIKTALLTSASENRKDILLDLSTQNIDIIFGTHALFQDGVEFSKLGLLIIDEQQRFGVYQRKKLFDKGISPDILSLSATPIPRTLALTIYRDLDVSMIYSKPQNRLSVDSFHVSNQYEKRFLNFAYKQIQKGSQVYVVASRVKDDDEDLESVESLYKRYKRLFKNRIKIDVLHGQMDSHTKEEIQTAFAEGKIDLLISSSIIEVGIDVSNANLMIIYDANRFGLSQLHQLRGRIGRGADKSYCIFVTKESFLANEKVQFISQNNDGFAIANKDLELRGAGDRMGLFQSGYLDDQSMDLYNPDMYETANLIADYLFDHKIYIKHAWLQSQMQMKLDNYNKIVLN